MSLEPLAQKINVKTTKRLRWHKRQLVYYNTPHKGEPFPPSPEVDMTPFQYFKQLFDDQLIDHVVEQTNYPGYTNSSFC